MAITLFKASSQAAVYILPAPTSYVGTTLNQKKKEILGMFYQDATTCRDIKAGVVEYGHLDKNGCSIKLDIKHKTVETQVGKFDLGVDSIDISGEFTIVDTSVDKWRDLLGSTASESETIAAASGKAGRESVFIGGSTKVNNFVVLFRRAAGMPVHAVSEYDNIVICQGTLEPAVDLKMAKGELSTMKVKINANPDLNLPNPDCPGGYEYAFVDQASTKAL